MTGPRSVGHSWTRKPVARLFCAGSQLGGSAHQPDSQGEGTDGPGGPRRRPGCAVRRLTAEGWKPARPPIALWTPDPAYPRACLRTSLRPRRSRRLRSADLDRTGLSHIRRCPWPWHRAHRTVPSRILAHSTRGEEACLYGQGLDKGSTRSRDVPGGLNTPVGTPVPRDHGLPRTAQGPGAGRRPRDPQCHGLPEVECADPCSRAEGPLVAATREHDRDFAVEPAEGFGGCAHDGHRSTFGPWGPTGFGPTCTARLRAGPNGNMGTRWVTSQTRYDILACRRRRGSCWSPCAATGRSKTPCAGSGPWLFGENTNHIRTGHAAHNIWILHRRAVNRLCRETTDKAGIALQAGWHAGYPLRALSNWDAMALARAASFDYGLRHAVQ